MSGPMVLPEPTFLDRARGFVNSEGVKFAIGGLFSLLVGILIIVFVFVNAITNCKKHLRTVYVILGVLVIMMGLMFLYAAFSYLGSARNLSIPPPQVDRVRLPPAQPMITGAPTYLGYSGAPVSQPAPVTMGNQTTVLTDASAAFTVQTTNPDGTKVKYSEAAQPQNAQPPNGGNGYWYPQQYQQQGQYAQQPQYAYGGTRSGGGMRAVSNMTATTLRDRNGTTLRLGHGRA